MKKVFLALVICLLFASTSFAENRAITKKLTISNVPLSSYSISSSDTVTTDSVYQANNIGFGSLALDVSGDITVSYQLSTNGTSWYTPYTTNGTALTSVGAIVSNITADRWIILSARMAPYIRFVLTANQPSTVSGTYIWQN